MCSISGVISNKLLSKKHEEKLITMMFTMQHRGPDENNILISNNVVLGNTRMSINDINSKTQPSSIDEIYSIFNGEIYNFKELKQELKNKFNCSFSNNCDTEVIPYLYKFYGEDFIKKIEGQFSIALYDKKNNCVFLYRDRLGKKPLYYIIDNKQNELYFASEITAISNIIDLELDIDEVFNIVSLWSVKNSPFKRLNQVKESTFIKIDINTLSIEEKEYWSLKKVLNQPKSIFNINEAKEVVYNELVNAVSKRLKTTDVGYGLYLSGGLDSTILAYLMNEHGSNFKSYSIAFNSNPEFNEEIYQKKVSQYYGIDNEIITFNDNDIYKNFKDYVLHTSQILFRTAPIPMAILSKEASKTEKVIFSGEGSDELFFGYDIFKEVKYSKLFKNKNTELQNHYIKKLYPYMLNDKHLMFMKYILLKNDSKDRLSSHKMRTKNLLQFKKYVNLDTINYSFDNKFDDIETLPLIKQAQYIEYKTLLSNYLLNIQGDLAAMKNSIEIRSPFLDHILIEKTNEIDDTIISPLFKEKNILKHIFKKDIPQEILSRPKQPYRSPDSNVFKNQSQIYEEISEYKNFGEFNKINVLELTKKIINSENTTYVDSFYFIVIYSSLILMNERKIKKFNNLKIHNIVNI